MFCERVKQHKILSIKVYILLPLLITMNNASLMTS